MDETQTKIFDLLDRSLILLDKLIDRKYPVIEAKDGEVWKKGDPIPEPKTPQEYRDFPSDQPGRFQQAINEARKFRSDR